MDEGNKRNKRNKPTSIGPQAMLHARGREEEAQGEVGRRRQVDVEADHRPPHPWWGRGRSGRRLRCLCRARQVGRQIRGLPVEGIVAAAGLAAGMSKYTKGSTKKLALAAGTIGLIAYGSGRSRAWLRGARQGAPLRRRRAASGHGWRAHALGPDRLIIDPSRSTPNATPPEGEGHDSQFRQSAPSTRSGTGSPVPASPRFCC